MDKTYINAIINTDNAQSIKCPVCSEMMGLMQVESVPCGEDSYFKSYADAQLEVRITFKRTATLAKFLCHGCGAILSNVRVESVDNAIKK